MYAPHPNRYQVEQIRKLNDEGHSVEEISRTLCVDEAGVEAHLPVAESVAEPVAEPVKAAK